MKQSTKTDLVCIKKILKYIALIDKTYSQLKVNSLQDLESNEICQLAIAQAVTNIYEVKKQIQEHTLCKAPEFNKILLKAARNIASHDYDSLDFKIIYRRTLQLLKHEITVELEAIINDFNQNSPSNK